MNYSKRNIQKKQKKLVSKHTKNKKKLSYILYKSFLFVFLFFIVIGVGAGFGMISSIIQNAPDIADIKESVQLQGFQTTIYNQDGKEITTLSTANSNRVYVEYANIPKKMTDAFIAIEDERFWDHNGVDAKGILRAFFIGIKNRHFSEGASTITQQLIKNQVFNVGLNESSFMDSLKRKIQEQYLAIELEKQIDKKDILELYLNAIYLGQGANGIQTASEIYFGKEDLNELTLSECAVIAAITQSPTANDPVLHPENNQPRKNTVLKNMLEQNLISQAEYDEAMADDVYARVSSNNNEQKSTKKYNSYYIDTVINTLTEQLVEELGYTETQAYNAIYSGGLSIYINQDAAIQKICDNEINNPDNYPASTSVALNYALTLSDPKSGDLYNYSSSHLLAYYKEKTGNQKYNLIYSSEDTARAAADEFKLVLMEETGYEELAESFSTTIQPQSSFVIMDQSTGYVKAICGGRGEKNGNLTLNRATDSKRQPGSTFKVLSTYVPALDTTGMTLATSYVDEPTNYSNGTPIKNWYTTGYRGRNSLRTAIKDSMNIITVKCFWDVTPQVGYDYLCNMGITTLKNGETSVNGIAENDINESMCLGGLTEGVTNVELTGAYAAIANKGTYIKPTFYTKVLDHNGNILIDNTPETKQVMKETTAWLINNAMQDVVTSGTGTAARLTSGMVVAGKTGTTSSNYDYWFCGSTPYYTASVWMGYDSNTNFSNSNTHKIIWRKIMDEIIEQEGQDTSATFEKPSDIVTATVCADSGLLPAKGQCKSTITEYFAKDTVPTKTCDLHQTITLCNESHYKATPYCPDTTSYHYTVDENGTISLVDVDFTPPENFMNFDCPLHAENTEENSEGTEDPAIADTVYTISTIAEGGGSITGPTQAQPGETVTLTFTPNDGYVLSNVTVDGEAKGAITSYTFENIDSDHTVTATFVANSGTDAPPADTIQDEDVYHENPYRRWNVTFQTNATKQGICCPFWARSLSCKRNGTKFAAVSRSLSANVRK